MQKKKSFYKFLLNIIPLDYFVINTRNISDIKQGWLKASAIKANKRVVKEVTLIKKLKYKNLVLKKFI